MLKKLFNQLIVISFLSIAGFQNSCSLTLNQAVHEAIAHHPAVRAARLASISEKHRSRQVLAGYLPSLHIRLLQAKENSQNPSLAASNIHDVTLHRQENQAILEQLIFDGGHTLGRIREQKYRHSVAHQQFNATLQSVASAAAAAFLNVARHRKLVSLAKDNIDAHQVTLKKVQKRFKGGAGRRVDVALGRARLALAMSRLDKAEGDLRAANANYLAAIGHYPPRTLVMPSLNRQAMPHTLKAALAQAEHMNPAIKAAQENVKVAKAGRHVAKAPFWPSLALQLSATQNRELDGIKGPDRDRMAAVVLNYNLYNGGGDLAGYRAARADYYEAQERALDTIRRVKQNVRNSWHLLKRTDQQVKSLQGYAKASVDVVKDYKTQFLLGHRALFNVLDAENELFISRSALANARFDRSVAYYDLFAQLGSLIEVVEMPMSE